MSAGLLTHPQVQAEGLVTEIESGYGPIIVAAPHWRFEKTPTTPIRRAPTTRRTPGRGGW